MSGRLCAFGGWSGCGGMLCLSCGHLLKRMRIRRYAVRPEDVSEPEGEYTESFVCAIAARQKTREGGLSLLGRESGEALLCLSVAAGGLDPAIAQGDRLELDGREWRVVHAENGVVLRARLVLCPGGE